MTTIKHEIECAEIWFTNIKNGIKKVEGRKQSPKFKNIVVGETIRFKLSGEDEFFYALVTDIKYYPSLRDYLQIEGVEKCLPGISDLEEAVKIYTQWSTEDEIKAIGFMGIHVRVNQ